MTVIVTLPAYTIGKALGVEEGMRELQRQVLNPDAASLPAVRTIARLRKLTDVQLRIDTGGTQLCAVRSRHAHEAWESGADVWFSVDDDNEATTPTLADMLEAVRGDTPRIVLAPYIIRGGETRTHIRVSVDLSPIVTTERLLSSGSRLRPITKGGFGLIAINRAALAAVREACSHLDYIDTDGVERLALFFAEIRNKVWLHDDFSFFARVPSHVSIEALLTGHTMHAGEVLDLSEVEP
jgi:hypothetical protein